MAGIWNKPKIQEHVPQSKCALTAQALHFALNPSSFTADFLTHVESPTNKAIIITSCLQNVLITVAKYLSLPIRSPAQIQAHWYQTL